VVLNGESLKDSFQTTNIALQSNISSITDMASLELSGSEEVIEQEEEKIDNNEDGADIGLVELNDDSSDLGENEKQEPLIKETDFMTKEAALAFEAKKNKTYLEPKFIIIKRSQAHEAIGYNIRVINTHGNTTIGLLTGIRGGKLVISKRVVEGEAIVPMDLAAVRKLEVYR